MSRFGTFLTSPVGSWLRVFVAAVLVLWLADLMKVGRLHWDPDEWGAWLAAGLIAVLPVVVAWFNPKDTRFGVGS